MKISQYKLCLVLTCFLLLDHATAQPKYGKSNNQHTGVSDGNSNVPKRLGKITTRPFHHTFLNYKGPTKHVGLGASKPSAYRDFFDDPAWTLQWYMQDYRTKAMPVMDHNVVPVYRMNINGYGVTVALVNAAVDVTHPDIKSNIAWQKVLSSVTERAGAESLSHGTGCAGLIAMVANNGLCGVGVAYGARLASVSALEPGSTEDTLASALVFNLHEVDVYSNSWGPQDDGRLMQRMGERTATALKTGAEQGRGGKGAIYVFGAGSGRENWDTCSADAFINNINTITIGSANKNGKIAHFTERCAAVMATAYASENINDDLLVTVDEDGRCVQRDLGNSGSVAIASGILALVLEANPRLTNRDVMHLIAVGSEVAPLADNEGTWFKNGAGFWLSSDFGFGLLNAENMVLLAQNWVNVGPRVTCIESFNLKKAGALSIGSKVTLKKKFRACHRRGGVYFTEHVELRVTVDYCFRGGLTVDLRSPKGTVSKILEPRPMDDSSVGLADWSMTSVQFWGEDPYGEWSVSIGAVFECETKGNGVVRKVELLFHGTSEKPSYHDTLLPRKYSGFRLPDGQNSAF